MTSLDDGDLGAGEGRCRRLVAVAQSEWIKLRSVRSTYLSLAVSFVLTIGLSALICQAYVARFDNLSLGDRLRFDPAFLSVSGVLLAQVAIGVLGVLTMTAEYATGMIRTTFSAVPRRLQVLVAKVVVFFAVSFVVGFLSCLASFFSGQAILNRRSVGLSLDAPGAWRVVLGAALYLAVLGLLGLGLGTLIRRTAGAVAALFGLLLVLPAIVSALPSPFDVDIDKYLPSEAGTATLHLVARPGLLSPWAGLGVFLAYGLAAVLSSAVLVLRRDA